MPLLQEFSKISSSCKLNHSKAGMETMRNDQFAHVTLILPLDHTQGNCLLSRPGQWIQSACSAPLRVGPKLAFSVF